MDCVSVYKCLCDETRLRILNLLREGPLCVCHVQEALDLPQSKVSKQLSYMKKHGVLNSRRFNNWTIYEIDASAGSLLEANLRELGGTEFIRGGFAADLQALSRIDTSVACLPKQANCCAGDC